MAIHEHPFFNFMFLAQVFIPPGCILRKSLDSAIVDFTKKWIHSIGSSYLEGKQTSKGIKLDKIRSLMSNREYSQKQKSDALASASKITAIQTSTSAETKDKK
jgi:hypothetical protein